MARASKLVMMDGPAHDMVRKYLAEYSTGTLNVAIKPVEGRQIMASEKATYTVLAVRLDKGSYAIINKPGSIEPRHGEADVMWLALLDVDSSALHLIPWAEWKKTLSTAGPQTTGLMVQKADGADWVFLNLAWAKAVSLIRRTTVLGSGDDSFLNFRDSKLVTPEQFCHLHVHSMYSFLDGASSIEGIAREAYLNGQPGIALTDHGFMFGTYKHWKACNEWGIKPVLGCELNVVDDVTKRYKDDAGNDCNFYHHLTVLAMNQEGWENLCELATMACRDFFYYVPRIGLQQLAARHQGLFILSGCFKGPAIWFLQDHPKPEGARRWWLEKNVDRAVQTLQWMKQLLGDRLAAECQSIDFDRYMQALPEFMGIVDHLGIPKVATCDCHYEREEDAIIQSILTRISKEGRIDEIGEVGKKTGPYFIKQQSQIVHPLFTADMFARTCTIMERCNVSLKKDKQLFPHYAVEQDMDWAAFCQSKGDVV